jgi:hypothetical protein
LLEILAAQRRQLTSQSQLLVRELKRLDHQRSRTQAKCNIITAVLHAMSEKRSEWDAEAFWEK